MAWRHHTRNNKKSLENALDMDNRSGDLLICLPHESSVRIVAGRARGQRTDHSRDLAVSTPYRCDRCDGCGGLAAREGQEGATSSLRSESRTALSPVTGSQSSESQSLPHIESAALKKPHESMPSRGEIYMQGCARRDLKDRATSNCSEDHGPCACAIGPRS